MHKGTVCLDRSPDDLIVVFKINYNDFRGGISDLLANADIVVGFKSLDANENALYRFHPPRAGPLTQVLKPMDEGFTDVSRLNNLLEALLRSVPAGSNTTYINSHMRQLVEELISVQRPSSIWVEQRLT